MLSKLTVKSMKFTFLENYRVNGIKEIVIYPHEITTLCNLCNMDTLGPKSVLIIKVSCTKGPLCDLHNHVTVHY